MVRCAPAREVGGAERVRGSCRWSTASTGADDACATQPVQDSQHQEDLELRVVGAGPGVRTIVKPPMQLAVLFTDSPAAG